MHVNSTTKNFHFQELDWIISFPKEGNQGKYVTYTVKIKKGVEPEKEMRLGDILESPEFEKSYPFTVRYFKSSFEKPLVCPSEFLEIRGIRCIDDFWLFLNALDI